MRLALGVEYDGSAYHGWQLQAHAPSVQAEVERALSKVADHPVQVLCAGRTDAGVHASGQVIHCDVQSERSMRSWVFGANANLPRNITVLWAKPVVDQFHARFSAQRRAYRYVIFSRDVRPSFLAQRVAWDYRKLAVAPMAEAAQHLIGEHDFSSFRGPDCQAQHAVRTLNRLDVTASNAFIYLDVEANGFLHHMVRNIAGVLMDIGAGEQPPQWAAEVLAHRNRTKAGMTAPAHGLYLVRVDYPEEFGIPVVSPPALGL